MSAGRICLNFIAWAGTAERLPAETGQAPSRPKIAGYSPVQRYFLGYALSWLFEERDALLRQNLLSDVHAPPRWRVNGPLSDIPDFYEAFAVKPGQALYRAQADRVHIW